MAAIVTMLSCVLLASSRPPEAAPTPFLPPSAREGGYELPAARADLRGPRLGLAGDPPRVVGWTDAEDRVVWDFLVPKSGSYVLVVEFAAPRGRGGALFEAEVDGQVRQGRVHETGDAESFLPQPLMTPVTLGPGAARLTLRARSAPHGYVMDLRRVRLVPEADR